MSKRVLFRDKVVLRVTREGLLDLPLIADFEDLKYRDEHDLYGYPKNNPIIKHHDIIEISEMPKNFYLRLWHHFTEEAKEIFKMEEPSFKEGSVLKMLVFSRFGFTVGVKEVSLYSVSNDIALEKMGNLLRLPRYPLSMAESLMVLVGDEFPYGFVFIERVRRDIRSILRYSGQDNIGPMSLSIIDKVRLNEKGIV